MSKKSDTMAIGIDLGTSITKLVGPEGKKVVKIPSLVGDPNPGWKGLGTDKSWINNLMLQTDDGKKYFVGELARLQSEIKRPLADKGKMKSLKDAIIAIKAALSIFVEKDYANLIVATGVPVASPQDEMVTLSKGLKGAMTINVANDATGEEKQINLKIDQCLVMPVCYGSYYEILKTSGEQRAVDAVVVDIGAGATNILTVYEGRLMRTASGSVQESITTLAERIASNLNQQTGKILRPFELIKSIEIGRKNVMVAGEQYDISETLIYYVNSISDVIVDELSTLLGTLPPDAWIEKVILTGGGAEVFGENMKSVLTENNIVQSPDEVIVPNDPVLANAFGFQKIAQAQIKSKKK
ncbi:MAG: ParM/StbA family protein [Asgard group archaeon]|nr:ParM/StbA family protein [Asgard group archaeon]